MCCVCLPYACCICHVLVILITQCYVFPFFCFSLAWYSTIFLCSLFLLLNFHSLLTLCSSDKTYEKHILFKNCSWKYRNVLIVKDWKTATSIPLQCTSRYWQLGRKESGKLLIDVCSSFIIRLNFKRIVNMARCFGVWIMLGARDLCHL
jgi:hypothetical protein